MECFKCKGKMIAAKLNGDMFGSPMYLSNREKGFFGGEKRSAVACFVCQECGYVELKADAPKDLL